MGSNKWKVKQSLSKKKINQDFESIKKQKKPQRPTRRENKRCMCQQKRRQLERMEKLGFKTTSHCNKLLYFEIFHSKAQAHNI